MAVLTVQEARKLVKAGEAVVLDNSILKTTAICHTQTFAEYVMHSRVHGLNLYLNNGSAAHEALAVWLENERTPKAAKAAMGIYDTVYEPIWEAAKEENEMLGDGDRMNFPRTRAILSQWLDNHEGSKFPFTYVEGSAEKAVVCELGMSLKDGRKVLYSAKLDAKVRKPDSPVMWSMDHKTCQSATEWWVGKQKVSSQFTGQIWASREMGQDIAGVIVNCIEYPHPHKSDNKCPIHKVSYQSCTVMHAGGTFVYVTRHEAEIESWLYTVKARVKEWDTLTRKAKMFDGWGALSAVQMQGRFNEGCTFCDFKQWCDNGRPTGEAQLKATFDSHTWDPLGGEND